jgi:hypothetical protein
MYVIMIVLTAISAVVLMYFQVASVFWVEDCYAVISLVALLFTFGFAMGAIQIRSKPRDQSCRHSFLLAIGVVAGVLSVVYVFGLYFGYKEANKDIREGELPYWHEIENERVYEYSSAPNPYMPVFLHTDKWSVFRHGYNAGYNVKAYVWSMDAVKNFMMAAEKGVPRAQYAMGDMYFTGYGVQQDHEEGIIWYRKAAEQDHRNAQFTLGCIYDMGEVVSEDNQEALRWYRKAAEYFDPRAMNNLARMYWYGDGVERDEVEAVAWGLLAKRRGIGIMIDVVAELDSYSSLCPQAETRADEIWTELKEKRRLTQ